MTEAVTETVEYTARENRKYAQRKLSQAQNALYGRSGLTPMEKLEQLKNAHVAAQKAVDALSAAFAQVVETVDFSSAEAQDAVDADNDGQIEVLEYVTDAEAQAGVTKQADEDSAALA